MEFYRLMENCSPDPPAAPLGLASLEEQGGVDLVAVTGTSPPAPIGQLLLLTSYWTALGTEAE